MAGDTLLAEESEITHRRHNEVLPEMVGRIYARAGVNIRDTRLIAVSIGPGSFTGLRVGLSFAKGLSLGTGAGIVPVGTLAALAWAIRECIAGLGEMVGGEDILCPMTVARKGEAFVCAFALKGGQLEAAGQPRLIADLSPGGFPGDLWDPAVHPAPPRVIIAGEGADELMAVHPRSTGRAIPDSGEDSGPLFIAGGAGNDYNLNYLPSVRASAIALGTLAWRRYRSGAQLPPAAELEPIYLKEFTVKSHRSNR